MEARYAALRRATEEVAAVDGHAHNLVELGSAFPFTRCFCEADGDALALAPHSLSFKRSVRDIASLYNCEASLEKVEEFRRTEGLKSIASKCFQAANISVILIDDGIPFDKMLDLESHKAFAPVVGRVLRIERLAETIINDVMFSTDGYAFPETYYLGANRSRDVVYRVLAAACEDGDLSIQEAIEAVEDIFRRNALHLYKLNVANGSINRETSIAADSAPLSSVEEDILFVRIIWTDASGQHRCRVVPAGRFDDVTRNKGVGLTFAAMGMTSFCDGPADGTNLTGVGEIRLMPDMPTLMRLPWPDLNDIGSGSHVHLSLWENGVNVFMGSSKDNFHGMSKTGEKFLAGVYHHLSSILAFTAPHPNSYDRIQPNTWSGAYLCWGKENREAPLRTACPPGVPLDLVSNFEIKSFDACANPHLGLAAIVAAGIDGLRSDLKLPEPIESNPADYASKLKRLPQNLQEAVESLSADKAEIDHYAKKPGAFSDLIHLY
nr:unnamed protein product [Digitaria exilis]